MPFDNESTPHCQDMVAVVSYVVITSKPTHSRANDTATRYLVSRFLQMAKNYDLRGFHKSFSKIFLNKKNFTKAFFVLLRKRSRSQNKHLVVLKLELIFEK